MRPAPAGVFIALALTAFAPVAAAQEVDEANELEWHVLEDETDDSFYAAGGWDVHLVFLGEAWNETAGGAGVYWRATLYGDHASPTRLPGNEYRATFTFEVEGAEVARSLWTADGTTYGTDFDALKAFPMSGDALGVIGFVLGESLGIGPGTALAGFKVETFVDGDLRDAAPGGVFVPGSGGRVEAPMESPGRLLESVILVGAGKFFDLGPSRLTGLGPNEYDGSFGVRSLLKEGDQHVRLRVVGVEGWSLTVDGPSEADLGPGEIHEFPMRFTFTGEPGVTPPLVLEFIGDTGGYQRIEFVRDLAALRVVEGGRSTMGTLGEPESLPAPVPVPGAVAALAALGLVAMAARRRG